MTRLRRSGKRLAADLAATCTINADAATITVLSNWPDEPLKKQLVAQVHHLFDSETGAVSSRDR